MRRALRVVIVFTVTSGFAWTQQDRGNDFCLDEFYGKGGRAQYSDEGMPARVEGELKIIMAMARDGSAGCAYFINGRERGAAEPKPYTVVFDTDPPPGQFAGANVVAHGKLNGSVLSVSSGNDPATFQVAATQVAAVSGNLNVNVILVNFLDSVLAASPAQVETMVTSGSSSLSNYYRETSFGKVSVSCTVRGPFTINYNGAGNCNYGQWASAADQAAGVSSGYRMYVLAPSGCGWAGLATLKGTQAWINGSYWNWQDCYCHEFGHNIGMHHAMANGSEYADHSCAMGNPNLPPHVNAPHKVEMGWMATGSVSTLTSGTQTYTLTALELSVATPQIVRIPKPDTGEYYYVSYRAPIGLDASNLESGYQFRTSIHRWSGTGGTKTALDALLDDGGTFTDAITGVSVTQTSHSGSDAVVTVSMGPANQAPVIQSGPSMLPNPLDLPGSATVSVTATDSDGPLALTYTWSSSGPGAATFSPNGTTASDSSTASFSVAGAYTLKVSVSDGRTSVIGSVAVTVIDPNMVNAPGNLVAAAGGRTVTLQWTDRSTNEDGFVVQRAPKASGNAPGTFATIAQLGANTTTYSDALSAAGTYYYRVQAFTNAGRTSAYSNTAKVRIR